MANDPLIPPLEMERPIRTDIPLNENEVFANIGDLSNQEFPEEFLELEDPEVLEADEDGSVTIAFGMEEIPESSGDFYENLTETMEEGELSALAADLLQSYHEDRETRQDWERTYSEGLSLLGMRISDRTEPFQGASGVYHPLLSEAVAQFQASAYKELLPAGGPVATRVVGKDSPDKTQQARRVKEFMIYQITDVMKEFDPELDQMLFYLPLSGSAFKKI